MHLSLNEWRLTIGEIVAPFGRIGEVKVRLETDFPERFKSLKQVCLRFPNDEAALREVESSRLHKGQILLKLRGTADIDAAEKLRGALVQVRADDAVQLPADEYYIYDLLGCELFTVEGRRLGVLASVLRGEANDAYVIRQEGGSELLLPAIKQVVREVDIAHRRIVVSPTPGLLPGEEEIVT